MVGEGTGARVERYAKHGIGRMWIARGRNIYTYPGEVWGFDNGAYRDWQAGVQFNADEYLRSLEKAMSHGHPPTLAVLPDIPAQGERSLAFSVEWLDRLGDVLPWYLAVQDGLMPDDVEPVKHRIRGVFLGGSGAYKATARMWCAWAHGNDLCFHYGRCSTLDRVAQAQAMGADSADSAFWMWEESRWQLLLHALHAPVQGDLFLEVA